MVNRSVSGQGWFQRKDGASMPPLGWVRRMQTRLGGNSNHTSVHGFGDVHHFSQAVVQAEQRSFSDWGDGGGARKTAAGLRVRTKGGTLQAPNEGLRKGSFIEANSVNY